MSTVTHELKAMKSAAFQQNAEYACSCGEWSVTTSWENEIYHGHGAALRASVNQLHNDHFWRLYCTGLT